MAKKGKGKKGKKKNAFQKLQVAKKRLVCAHCGKSFKNSKALTAHHSSRHPHEKMKIRKNTQSKLYAMKPPSAPRKKNPKPTKKSNKGKVLPRSTGATRLKALRESDKIGKEEFKKKAKAQLLDKNLVIGKPKETIWRD